MHYLLGNKKVTKTCSKKLRSFAICCSFSIREDTISIISSSGMAFCTSLLSRYPGIELMIPSCKALPTYRLSFVLLYFRTHKKPPRRYFYQYEVALSLLFLICLMVFIFGFTRTFLVAWLSVSSIHLLFNSYK